MLKEIEGQISQIREQLLREAVTGHPLLNARWLEIESVLILARLLLLSAKLNQYDFAKLKSVAVALELLNLAVKRHYGLEVRGQRSEVRGRKSEVGRRKPLDDGCRKSEEKDLTSNLQQNLSLITGDYYYAKALCLVAQLKDSRVIEILSQAVAFIAEGMAEESGHTDGLRKRASLYTAACHLGAYLSESDPETIEVLKRYGENFGIAHQMIMNGQESEQAKNFFEAARQVLLFLPESPPRFYLADLLPFLRSGDL